MVPVDASCQAFGCHPKPGVVGETKQETNEKGKHLLGKVNGQGWIFQVQVQQALFAPLQGFFQAYPGRLTHAFGQRLCSTQIWRQAQTWLAICTLIPALFFTLYISEPDSACADAHIPQVMSVQSPQQLRHC